MLTEVAVKQAKPRERKYRLYDQGGLYLEVTPTGRKYWRYKFRVRIGDVRKEKRLALGVYPGVSLKQARLAHASAKLQVANGDDPTTIRRLAETAKALEADHFFGDIAKDWFETQSPTWSASHTVRQTRLLFKDLAALHPLPIKAILAPELLRELYVIEARGAIETAAPMFRAFELTLNKNECNEVEGGALARFAQRRIDHWIDCPATNLNLCLFALAETMRFVSPKSSLAGSATRL